MTWWKRWTRPASDDPACALMDSYCDGDAAAFRDLYDIDSDSDWCLPLAGA